MTSETRPQLAYENKEYLESEDARPLRILAEYLEPLARFRRAAICDTIVFFGSARLTPDGPLGRYYNDAVSLARLITQWSKSLPSHAHRHLLRRRPRDHGGGEPGCIGGQWKDDRTQHQSAS